MPTKAMPLGQQTHKLIFTPCTRAQGKTSHLKVLCIPGRVHTIKFMIQLVFTRHVAEGAKVIVIALDTVPSHSSQLEATDITNHTMMLDP